PGLEVDGAIPYSLFLMGVGRPREAARVLEHLRDNDPLLSFPSLLLQVSYEMTGDYDAALAEHDRAVRVGIDAEVASGTLLLRSPRTRRRGGAPVLAVRDGGRAAARSRARVGALA